MEFFVWNISPILHIGPIQVSWYGLFFVSSFFLGALIITWMYKREGKDPFVVPYIVSYVIIGTAIGARLGHCFFYEPEYYFSHPLEILYVSQGGMASHGALIGIVITLYFFSRKYQESYIWIISRIVIPGTLTAFLGRFGNFFNSEILGKPTDLSWAIIFERVDLIPRHPVQLYEAFAYFIILIILLTLYRKVQPTFATKILPGTFLVLLFSTRFFIEYTKVPQEKYITGLSLNTGQLLSIPFILVGLTWMIWALKNRYTKEKS